MKKLAEEWLRFAEKDLLTIEKILSENELTNIVAFHSHQCIEKAFKAIIVIETEQVPRIHNLIRLYGTVRNYFPMEINLVALEQINETYIDSRYPSDIGLLPEGNLSQEKAVIFNQEARNIFEQVSKRLKNKSE